MIDLISNNINNIGQNDLNELKKLSNKYSSLLELKKNTKHLHQITYIIDVCVNYLSNINDINSDWKSMMVLLVIKKFEKSSINNKNDIIETIDDFIKYKSNNYDSYSKMYIYSDDYYKNYDFILKYLNNV